MGKERENNEKARKASHFYYLVTFFVSAQFGRKWEEGITLISLAPPLFTIK